MITVDEHATPFRAQHAPTQTLAVGLLGGSGYRVDCICGWPGQVRSTRASAIRQAQSHLDAERKLSKAQVRWLRELHAVGRIDVPRRTADPLVRRGLIETERGYPWYRITPAGRGVLIEHDRLNGGPA